MYMDLHQERKAMDCKGHKNRQKGGALGIHELRKQCSWWKRPILVIRR